MLQLDKNILLVISFIFSVSVYIANSLYAKKVSRTKSDFYFFMVANGAICAATIFVCSGSIGNTSVFSVLLGIVFGVICMVQTVTNLKAFALGPFSYTTILVSLSTVIPTLAGPVLSRIFGWEPQSVTIPQWIGIALMVVCIALTPEEQKTEEEKKISAKWFALSMIAAVTNGLIGVLQMFHQQYEGGKYAGESTIFLLTAFAVAILSALAILVFRRVKYKDDPETKISCKFKLSHIAILLVAGVSIGICHVVNLFLSGVMPSAILFPIINICPLIVTTAFAMIIFKERLSVKRWIGIVIGIISMLFVGGVINF